MILLDRRRVDTLQFAVWQNAEQVPAEIQCRVDVAVFVESLVDEFPLEILREPEVELVTGRECLFTDNCDEITEAPSLRVGIVELVRDLPMIVPRTTLPDSLLHQS